MVPSGNTPCFRGKRRPNLCYRLIALLRTECFRDGSPRRIASAMTCKRLFDCRGGIACGYATLGCIGFQGRLDYTAIGTITNLAARLCGNAQERQILVDEFLSLSSREPNPAPRNVSRLTRGRRPYVYIRIVPSPRRDASANEVHHA